MKDIVNMVLKMFPDTAPTVALDFDGPIATEGAWPDIGELVDGAKESIIRLKKAGWHIMIWSARLTPVPGVDIEDQKQRIVEFLDNNDVPYDDIWGGSKPRVHVLIDDRAIEFNDTGLSNNWREIVERLTKM